jgi:hypothetical protein
LTLALITTSAQLRDWANKQPIKVISSVAELERALIKKVDYLFSIVNPIILSDKLLKKVKKLAIN